MRVAVYYNNRDIHIEERPVPEIGPGELLVKVEASGICGSDVMEWYRVNKAPLVLGHEVTGTIISLGAGIEQYQVGERVALAHHVPCNTCRYCLSGNHTVCETLRKTSFDPGGFAEYLRLPAINVDRGIFRLPDDVSFLEGSFVEPLACVLRGQRKANIELGQTVLVIGSGLTGLLHIQLASALGAGRIIATDVVKYRLRMAKKFGASDTIESSEDVPHRLRDLNEGRLADLVIVCTGAKEAQEQALKSVDRGGTILFFAPTRPEVSIPVYISELFFNSLKFVSSYAGSPADYAAALDLIHFRRVNVKEMVTHRLKLEETGKGFQLVSEAKDSMKVIIEPHE